MHNTKNVIKPHIPFQGRARDRRRAEQKILNNLNKCEAGHATCQDKACCNNEKGVCNLTVWGDPLLLRAIRVYVHALSDADQLAFLVERRLMSDEIAANANLRGTTRNRRLHQCYLEPPDEVRDYQ